MTFHRDPGYGFASPIFDSQAVFRLTTLALSRPGLPQLLGLDGLRPPAGLAPAAAAFLLTMADSDTPVWLKGGADHPAATWLGFHAGASTTDRPEAAAFAVVDGTEATPRFVDFDAGDERYPDRSATLLVTVAALDGGQPVRLTGPGLREAVTIAPSGLRPDFWADMRANAALYPRGLDVILVAGEAIIGLPRSTQIEEIG